MKSEPSSRPPPPQTCQKRKFGNGITKLIYNRQYNTTFVSKLFDRWSTTQKRKAIIFFSFEKSFTSLKTIYSS